MIIYFEKDSMRGSLRIYPAKLEVKSNPAMPEPIRDTFLEIIGDQGEHVTLSGNVDELVGFIDTLNRVKEKITRAGEE